MESKKINQLATELAPDLSDLTIIGDPTTGISKKITLSQMASLFTGTVEEYANLAAFPITGVADTIYVAKDTNVIYRWDSTAYVVLSPNVIASLVFSDANGFDGTISLVGSVATLTITTALTSGSVPFIGASGALTQDNSNLFFDDTNNRLGIATASPTTALDVFGSGIIGRLNATSTNNSFLGFASNGTNKWSAGNVQSDHRFRIFSEANSAELVSVLQTGEFGIGIANPTTKFHIDGSASALIANLDANVSIAKSISFRSDNSARFNIEVSGTESGSNVGADFFLRTFTDAGSLLETPFSIVRSTGVTTIKSLTLTNVLSVANGGTGSATQNFVDLTTTQTIAGLKTFSSEVSASSGLITLSGNAVLAPTGMVGLRYVNNRLLIYGGSTDITFQKNSNSGPNLTILESGAATFTGEVNVTSGLLSISGSGGAPPTSGVGLRFVSNRLLIYGGSTDITFQKNSNAGPNLTILESGVATFTNNVVTSTYFNANNSTRDFYFNSSADLGFGPLPTIQVASAHALQFATSNTKRMEISSGGAVAINTNATANITLFPKGFTSGTGSFTIAAQNSSSTFTFILNDAGNVTISGSLSKGSGSFRIEHPLESLSATHDLVHSFVESPQANNIYRGKVELKNGKAEVNIDEVSTMTEGTFIALNREIHTYTSNETDWDAVRGKVEGNILIIECQNNKSNAIVSWLVIGERQDKHIMDTDWTDENGKVIVEPLKQIMPQPNIIETETISPIEL